MAREKMVGFILFTADGVVNRELRKAVWGLSWRGQGNGTGKASDATYILYQGEVTVPGAGGTCTRRLGPTGTPWLRRRERKRRYQVTRDEVEDVVFCEGWKAPWGRWHDDSAVLGAPASAANVGQQRCQLENFLSFFHHPRSV